MIWPLHYSCIVSLKLFKTHVLIDLYNLKHTPAALDKQNSHNKVRQPSHEKNYCWFELQYSRLLISELLVVSFLATSENLQMVLSMFFSARNDVLEVPFSTS